ncbi:MAG: PfkB family carbohydrate kinase [bacterium]
MIPDIDIHSLYHRVIKALEKIKDLKILVMGDIILDRWLKGVVERISPEAPVPVLRVEKEWNDLGGAGNVAKILSYYCPNVTLMGFLGKDQFSVRVKNLLQKYNIKSITSTYDKTIVKTRLIAQNNQQIARVDREKPELKFPAQLIEDKINQLQEPYDLLIMIDYNKGFFSYNLMGCISQIKVQKVYLSPKPSNFELFEEFMKTKQIECISLNRQEFQELSKIVGLNKRSMFDSMKEFIQRYNIASLLVTLGKEGLSLVNKERLIKVDGFEVEVFDVTGAGDNVVSIFALFNYLGFDCLESGMLANIAGSICVSKPGTIAVKPKDILTFLEKTAYETSKR